MKIKQYAAFIFAFILGLALGHSFAIKHRLDLALVMAASILLAAYLRKKWKKEDNLLFVIVFIVGLLSGYGLSEMYFSSPPDNFLCPSRGVIPAKAGIQRNLRI